MIETSGKQIATNKISIKDCFNNDMWFNVPDYQRPYVWASDQINNLLDDISYAALNLPNSQYFLGSMVLHSTARIDGDTSYQENAILDGQQRITTLYLIHAVIRDLSTDKKIKKSCSTSIFQEGDPYDGIPERLRIEFSIRQEVEEFIDKYIKVDGGTRAEDLVEAHKSKNVSVRNMANALTIIHKWFEDPNNLSINQLFPFLRQNVIMVYVASAELEDAFRLFTVLNDRGIKLRNSDILKAQNLKEVINDKKRNEYALFWEQLEGDLEEDFDQFLSYIRTILTKEKARLNLLKEFDENIYNPTSYDKKTRLRSRKEPLLKKGEQTFQYIKVYKDHFDQIFSSNNYHVSSHWGFDNLISLLQYTALSDIWIPPLMAYRKNVGEHSLFEFLVKLDNKFSGDWIARETPTFRIEAMNDIISKIEKTVSLGGSKEQKAKKILESNVFEFDFDQFTQQIRDYTIYGRRYTRYLLRKIDWLLEAPSFSKKESSDRQMSAEHILPQTPKNDSQWKKDFTDDQIEEWKDKLGNLVLISRRKNSSQGRLDFKDKKEKYFKHSIETFPNSIRVIQSLTWTLQDLEKNHKYVVDLLINHYKENIQ